jgi:hypothetical protein
MIRTIRVARTALLLSFTLIGLTIVGGLIYLNQVGFPGRYGDWLKSELASKGLYLSFQTLRFDFKQGLVATDVSLYSDEGQSFPLLEGREMALDLDKTKALRGKFKLHSLIIIDGTAHIPVDHDGRKVIVRDIHGKVKITETERIIVDGASGLIEGLRVNLSTDLRISKLKTNNDKPKSAETLKSNHVLKKVLEELALWTFSEEAPPQLAFNIKGDLGSPKRLQTSFRLDAVQLKRGQYQLRKILIAGDLQAQIVTLDEISLQDESGSASGQADWSISRNDGRFNLKSDLHIQDFLNNCFDVKVLKDLTISGTPPILKVNGSFSSREGGGFLVTANGHGDINEFSFLETDFDELSSDFSWKDGDLYLRDLEIIRKGDHLNGNIMRQGDQVRFDLISSLPLDAFKPFIKEDGPLEQALAHVTLSEKSTIALDVAGTLNLADRTDWSATGKVFLNDVTYKATRFYHLSTNYKIAPDKAEFFDIEGLLNDDQESIRLRHNGAASDPIYVDRILHDLESHLITIQNLRGKAWATPVVRIFAPNTATHIEETYRFHSPPRLSLNGTFAEKEEDSDKNSFIVEVRTEGQTDYPFLGSHLPLQNLNADLTIRGTGITVQNLTCGTLNGSIAGSVFCDVTPGQKTKYRGAIKWDDLSFQRLSQVYKFKEEEKGTLTGSIDFRGNSDGLRGFNAEGLLAINQGNLISLPILGPLSPVISGLLGDKRVGYERAKDASANFNVTNGVLTTKDFIAISTNVTLTGEGSIDLLSEKLDMTIRMNARGLLGLFTLPLQPLKGIFQFRGTGTHKKPKWRSSPFTRPEKGKNDPIYQKTGKAQIIRE